MPRNGGGLRHQAAHPQAAAAAAAPQAKPPNSPKRYQSQTEINTTTNRSPRIKLTPFKPGFETQTEWELALAFKRPPRLFQEDSPFYPWLPRPVPLVNFHLNFKF